MKSIPRALHYVLKIGNRKKNINFFKDVLGMKVIILFDENIVPLIVIISRLTLIITPDPAP